MVKKMKGGSLTNTTTTALSSPINTNTIIICFFAIICGLLLLICYILNNKNISTLFTTPSRINNETIINTNSTTPFNDPYAPPLKPNLSFLQSLQTSQPLISQSPANAINIQTRGYETDFTQIGFLTKKGIIENEPKILPLMGRKTSNARDKYQYYTISNSGNVNTKLPIRKDGRNCVDEYGCNEIFNNDTVYVEGYNDTFKATVFENSTFRYIPVSM